MNHGPRKTIAMLYLETYYIIKRVLLYVITISFLILPTKKNNFFFNQYIRAALHFLATKKNKIKVQYNGLSKQIV